MGKTRMTTATRQQSTPASPLAPATRRLTLTPTGVSENEPGPAYPSPIAPSR